MSANGPFSAQIQRAIAALQTGLTAFTNLAITAGGYLNFGATLGSGGYGFRDSAGTIQYKDSGGSWVPFPSGGQAPAASLYVVEGIADASLPNAQFTGALATGIVKNTTTTGVLSIASPGTDYQTPTGTPAGFVIASQATGDILAASSATAWTRVPDVAVGSVLQSGGIGALPSYGQIAPLNLAPQVAFATMWDGVATGGRYSRATTGGGAITDSTSGATLSLVTVASSAQVNLLHGTKPIYPMAFSAQSVLGTIATDFEYFVGLGVPTVASTGITWTDSHAGFKITRASSGTINVYATAGNGVAEVVSSSLATGVTLDAFDLFCTITSSTTANFAVRKNGGSWTSLTPLTITFDTANWRFLTIAIDNINVSTNGNVVTTSASVWR
jgi:hypothetical protein